MSLRADIARHGLKLLALLLLSAVALQLVFALRIGLMTVVDPESTTFQRSEAWRLLVQRQQVPWSQQWVGAERISAQLKRAVIASEDASFTDHGGVDWDAIERAWERNQVAHARADRRNDRAANGQARSSPKIVGGSTITQQLAKNLFLSGERTPLRKAQEFVLTLTLEALMSKRRILEIYLNNVEWGEGLFGAQAAARLAVMLPAPKRFEQRPGSAYVTGRAATVLARMPEVVVP